MYTHGNISTSELSTTALNEIPMRAINSDGEKQLLQEDGAPRSNCRSQAGHHHHRQLDDRIRNICLCRKDSSCIQGVLVLHLLIWMLTGCMALCGALCYAELGTAIPGSGGETQYLERGFGRWAAFVFEWTAIMLLRPASISWFMEAFSKHAMMAYIAARGLPWISDVKELSNQYKWQCKAIAVMGCLVITLSASISTKASDRIQGVLTFGKIASLVVHHWSGSWV